MADSYVIRQGTERNTNPMFMEIMARDLTELAKYASKCTPGSIGYLEDATVYRLGTQGEWVKVGDDFVSRFAEKADKATTYTKTESDAAISAAIAPKADQATTYTKTEVDAAIAPVTSQLAEKVSETSLFDETPSKNRFNIDDPDFLTGKLLAAHGSLSDNASYNTTGYISVTPGEIIFISYILVDGSQAAANLRTVAAYNSSKVVQSASGTNTLAASYTVPAGISFIRTSYSASTYGTTIQIEANDRGFTPYEAWSELSQVIKGANLRTETPLHAFLPRELYVAVDRTIELYNNQVCLEADKYHFRWICHVGKGLERKYTITGAASMLSSHSQGLPDGQYKLSLYLYNDNMEIVWSSFTIIKVVSSTAPTKKILPIGDSLTNWKAWLQETILLSGGNITFAGTRYSGLSVDSASNEYASGTILHEGRSGWSASSYLTNTSYTFDDRYSGATGVLGTVNPFLDGDSFSLTYYLTAQDGHIGGTPDAVQIFLGTNGIELDPTTNATNIKALVDIIRAEYPTMPIFVVNTIYRSGQNGYTTNPSAWRYEEDCKVFNLMKRLDELLNMYTGVTLVPVAVCHDTAYNFGVVETPVNPRAAQKEYLPAEAVHPQGQGYFQMADLLFSTYCGVLSA